MIIIKINTEDIELAKEIIAKFDSNKVYNKFKCKNNYIGVLGEILFDRYLTKQGVPHKWVEFIKESSTEPDFYLNGKSIDIKTTTSNLMWYQTPIHDIYIYCRIVGDLFIINSYITREELIGNKNSNVIVRGERWDNTISPFWMHNINNETFINGGF